MNVTNEYQFRALKHRPKEIRELDPSKDTLETFQSDMVVKSEFNTSTGKEIEVKLEMDPEAIPVAQKPHPTPYHLQKPLKEWLEQAVKENIFQKVPDGETITWCSPLVVQPKPQYANMKNEELESQMIRASIDMRIPNEAMKRNRSRCVQSPTVDDFIYRLHDCKIFTKWDLRQVYHQLILDPATTKVATFSTPWGNYRPKKTST